MKRILPLFLFAVAGLVAAADRPAVVNTDWGCLNLRRHGYRRARAVQCLPKGTPLTVLGPIRHGYVKVMSGGVVGYVWSPLLRSSSRETTRRSPAPAPPRRQVEVPPQAPPQAVPDGGITGPVETGSGGACGRQITFDCDNYQLLFDGVFQGKLDCGRPSRTVPWKGRLGKASTNLGRIYKPLKGTPNVLIYPTNSPHWNKVVHLWPPRAPVEPKGHTWGLGCMVVGPRSLQKLRNPSCQGTPFEIVNTGNHNRLSRERGHRGGRTARAAR